MYDVIYADPPWKQKRGCPFGKSGNSLDLEYPTMTVNEIRNLKVKDICSENSVLFLWVTNKYIEDSFSIVKSWGFKKSSLLTWCKKPMGLGLGGAFVQTTEYLIYARRGSLKPTKRIDSTWFQVNRQNRHSKKPDFFADMIVDMFGDLKRIELFARDKKEGWDVFGNEVFSDIEDL